MNETYQIRVYLEDECPRIGSGWRTLTVTETDDYTYVTDSLGRRVRMKFTLLAEIKKASERRLQRAA
jgi:hypothetical protein